MYQTPKRWPRHFPSGLLEPLGMGAFNSVKPGLTRSNLCNQQVKCLSMELFTQNTGGAFSLILIKEQKPYNPLVLTPFTNVETSPVHGLIFSRPEIKIENFKM